MNQIWDLDRVFTNHLLPQQKLLSKTRQGAKVIKRHDAGATPHQRAVRRPTIRPMAVRRVDAEFNRVRVGALSGTILDLTGRLETLAIAKRPAPLKPPVNRAWNDRQFRRS